MGNIRIFQEIWKKKVITKHVSAFIVYDVQYTFYTCSNLYKCELTTTPQLQGKKTNLKDKDAILK